MKLSMTCNLHASTPIKVELPNFARDQRLTPKTLTFEFQENNVRVPARDLTCRATGITELCYMREPYFQCSNVIQLDRLDGAPTVLDICGGKTLGSNPRHLVLSIEYEATDGIITYQNTFNEVDKIMKDIGSNAGYVYTLMLSFNKPVKGAQLVPLFETSNEDQWISGLELGDTNENNAYVIDFSGELKIYAEYLEYLTLRIDSQTEV